MSAQTFQQVIVELQRLADEGKRMEPEYFSLLVTANELKPCRQTPVGFYLDLTGAK